MNQTPSCICSMCLHCMAKSQIVPSKAVVGVDRPMKAPSMHIQKPNKGKLSKFSQLSFRKKLFFSEQNSFMHMFNVFKL